MNLTLSRLDTALALAALGYWVVPLFGPIEGDDKVKGKRPRQGGWQRKCLTDTQLAAVFAAHPDGNLGIKTGVDSGIVVVDIDPRNGGLFWYDAHFDELALVPHERTGSGGFHLYFEHPGGHVATTHSAIAPGVDLLGDGGAQVVTAPSIHRNGQPYVWEGPGSLLDPASLPILPAWIATPGAAPVKAQRSRKETYTDAPDDIARCEARLAELPPAVEGEAGDAATFRAACLGRDFGLSPGIFLPLITAWNERCSPPWDHDDLVAKVRNAYRYAREGAPGIASPSTAFEPVAAADPGLPISEPAPTTLSPEAAKEQAEAITDWTKEIVQSREGWKNHTRNLELIFTHDKRLADCFRHNLFTNAPEVVRAPWRTWAGAPEWTDTDATALSNYLVRAFDDRPTFTAPVIYDGVRCQAMRATYHPIRDYLDSLTWDGVARIQDWLCDYLGAASTPYVRAVARRFLIAAVARVRRPGCKVDTMLVLEGQQGMLKSTAARVLFGEAWFTDAELDIGSKDAAAIIRGRWCVEVPELTAAGKAEVNALKAFISRQVDRQRDAYGRAPEDHPRQGVFIGTTNKTEYLRDATGGRRFWPIAVDGKAEIELLRLVRDQLWAEAAAAYDAGEHWWLTDEEEAAARGEQESRYLADEWGDAVVAWLDSGGDFVDSSKPRIPIDRVTGLQVYCGALSGSPVTFRREVQQRIADIMEHLGWVRKPYRLDGRLVKGFVRPLTSVTKVTL